MSLAFSKVASVLRRHSFLAALLSIVVMAIPAHAETNACSDDIKVHRNIVFLGFPCPPASTLSVVPTRDGIVKLIEAIELLYTQSPESAKIIERLKENGPVLIVYDPAHPAGGGNLTSTQIAFFLPTFVSNFDKDATGKQFTMFVGRDGMQWPLKELAAVIVHELMGHGNQHLEDRLDTMRPLDVECEAWLLEDIVYQDLKMDKQSREMIDYRQQLEYIHCSDFIRYMRKWTPEEAKLWDQPDLQVTRLLGVFDAYIAKQREQGVIQGAQEAQKRQLAEAIKKAERKNDPEELFGIGASYMLAIGKDPDPAEAAKWFARAAKQGHKGALLQLAALLADGNGIDQNLPLARKFYVKAAKAGEPEALYALGTMFETGTGVEKDLRKAAAFYKEASPGYDLRYHLIFGYLFREGIGFPKDVKKAYGFYLQAARLGNTWSQFVIGEMHDRGEGVEANPTEALRWWWKAAQAGLPQAQNNVASRSLNGRGVKKDVKRALEYFTKAAEQDFAQAQANLAYLYQKGIGTQKDNKTAAQWFRKAARNGIASSQFELARMLEKGIGVKQSLFEAVRWYKKAADQGHEEASRKLKTLNAKL